MIAVMKLTDAVASIGGGKKTMEFLKNSSIIACDVHRDVGAFAQGCQGCKEAWRKHKEGQERRESEDKTTRRILWSIAHGNVVEWLAKTRPELTLGSMDWTKAYREAMTAMHDIISGSWGRW